ncbi:hypothetical protein ACR6C2_01890 [Streptomyces sp. INA 01156]
MTRCAARNAAEVLLCAVGNPAAAGEAFNVADDDQQTTRQWAESIAMLLGAELEFVGVPSELAPSAMGELLSPRPARTSSSTPRAPSGCWATARSSRPPTPSPRPSPG